MDYTFLYTYMHSNQCVPMSILSSVTWTVPICQVYLLLWKLLAFLVMRRLVGVVGLGHWNKLCTVKYTIKYTMLSTHTQVRETYHGLYVSGSAQSTKHTTNWKQCIENKGQL